MSKKLRNWEFDDAKPSERVIPEETRRSPGKKNTRRWCRGKVGVEHVAEVRLSKWGMYRRTNPQWSSFPPCRWDARWRRDGAGRPYQDQDTWRWHCSHQIVCGVCGKILHSSLPAGTPCPDYHPREVTT